MMSLHTSNAIVRLAATPPDASRLRPGEGGRCPAFWGARGHLPGSPGPRALAIDGASRVIPDAGKVAASSGPEAAPPRARGGGPGPLAFQDAPLDCPSLL